MLSHRANWLRTFVGATTQPGRRRHRVHVPAVPHGRLDDRARRVAGAARRCTSCACPTRRRCSRPTARHRAARLYCIPAVWGRILEHGVDGYDLSSLVEADTGTSATPPELLAAIKDALPHTVTRVFYGSTEAGPALSLADVDLVRASPAASASRNPASRCGSTSAARSACAARS